MELARADVVRAEPLIRAARVVVCQLETPLDTILAGFELARKHGGAFRAPLHDELWCGCSENRVERGAGHRRPGRRRPAAAPRRHCVCERERGGVPSHRKLPTSSAFSGRVPGRPTDNGRAGAARGHARLGGEGRQLRRGHAGRPRLLLPGPRPARARRHPRLQGRARRHAGKRSSRAGAAHLDTASPPAGRRRRVRGRAGLLPGQLRAAADAARPDAARRLRGGGAQRRAAGLHGRLRLARPAARRDLRRVKHRLINALPVNCRLTD